MSSTSAPGKLEARGWPLVLVADGGSRVVKRRETLEDVHVRDLPLAD